MTARWLAVVAVAASTIACGRDMQSPTPSAANVDVVTDLPSAGVAGSAVGSFTVRVMDADGRPLPGVLVRFAASLGAARVDPPHDTTGDDGLAGTSVTLSPTPGPNQIAALVAGAGNVRSRLVEGAAGEARMLTFGPRVLWFQPTIERRTMTATPRDEHGNLVGGPVSWISRNPALVSLVSTSPTTADVAVVSRPGETYLVATHGSATDSVLVAVHDAASSRCDFLASPTDLAVGRSAAFEHAGLVCVRGGEGAEYIVVAHYNSPVANVTSGVGIVAHGIQPRPASGEGGRAPVALLQATDAVFENALRARERANVGTYVPAARTWYDERARMRSLAAVSRVGDRVTVNVNPFEFCTEPTERTARVAALTSGTMILEDTSNPSGGFTDEEYRSIATTVDTLVTPVNLAAFGSPTDIDGNGRIAILFTRAVNELTPRGSGGVVLGFYYSRDLLPRTGIAGACPASNVAEIFYVLVPDPTAVASDARSKAFVEDITVSTIAHELQHLINASRRMYVTRAQEVTEESWLNEGLSHIAEELVFYRASGLAPRQNIGADRLSSGTPVREMHDLFMRGNFGRLAQFIEGPESNSPMAANDQLATRGASWAFLRYLADRAGAVDGDLWRRLVDGRRVGVPNVDAAMMGTGLTAVSAMRDWSASVAVDDVVPGLDPALTQPSWDFATAMPALGYKGSPTAVLLQDGQGASASLRAGGSKYFQFVVGAGGEALVQVSSGGGVAQPGMRLTILRIK